MGHNQESFIDWREIEMFTQCQDVYEIKSEYRRLAKLHHPDLGGDTATMQRVNELYQNALALAHGQIRVGTDGKEHTYKYNQAWEQAIMDKVLEVLGLGLDNLVVEIIGVWVWVSGSTRAQKDLLNRNGVGLRWHGKRQMWYWKPYAGRTHYSKRTTDDLRRMYGSRKFNESDSQTLRLAN
jgi:hypothetical protein